MSDGEMAPDAVQWHMRAAACELLAFTLRYPGEELAEERASVLYQLDRKAPMRFSHENPAIRKLYEDFLGKPLSAKAEALLHTDHESWQMPGRKS